MPSVISGVSALVLSLLPPPDGTEVTGVGVVLSSSLSLTVWGEGGSTLGVGEAVGGAPAMLEGRALTGGAEEEEKRGVEATGGVVESGQV